MALLDPARCDVDEHRIVPSDIGPQLYFCGDCGELFGANP